MTTVKVKLRRSRVEHLKGALFIQIIHCRKVRFITTRFKLHPHEWNECKQSVCINSEDMERGIELYNLQKDLDAELKRLHEIINKMEYKGVYTTEDVKEEFTQGKERHKLSVFMNQCIAETEKEGKKRTAETYRSTWRMFMKFRMGEDIDLDRIDMDLICDFERYLKIRNLARNSTSFYMRILRSIYRKAVSRELCADKCPFHRVYTGVDKTVKRAVDEKVIAKIKKYKSGKKGLLFARDLFLFSFYTRGMAFVDIYYLKRSNMVDDKIYYVRAKTGKKMSIQIEPCIQTIIDRYATNGGKRLFPFSESKGKNGEHTGALWLYNQRLKTISMELGLKAHLTSYVSRHTWASIAKRKGVSTSIISECMGHSNEATTYIYLASFEQNILDTTNQLVIGSIKKRSNVRQKLLVH